MYLSQFLYKVFSLSYRARKWYLLHLHSWLTPETVKMKMEDGSLLYVRPRFDYVQREIYLNQGKYAYESHVVKWLIRNLRQDDAVVDVGSHIGYYLGPICRKIGLRGKAFFVEPLPDHHVLLQRNISANEFTCAMAIRVAMSDRDGEVVFYPAKDSGRNSLVKNRVTDNGAITIQATTLDELFNKYALKQIDLLLVDVEGAEVLVFQGASECFKQRKIRMILFEWHPLQMKADFNTAPYDFLKKIVASGFSVARLDDVTGEEMQFDIVNVEKYQHLLFRLEN